MTGFLRGRGKFGHRHSTEAEMGLSGVPNPGVAIDVNGLGL